MGSSGENGQRIGNSITIFWEMTTMNSLTMMTAHGFKVWKQIIWNMQTNRYGWISKYLKVWSSVTHQWGFAGDSPTSLSIQGFAVALSGEALQRFLGKTPVWNQILFYFPASLRLRRKDMGLYCLWQTHSLTLLMNVAEILLQETDNLEFESARASFSFSGRIFHAKWS